MQDTGGEDFGRLLRRFRRDAELTQEALAERAGLSVRGLGDLERGVSQAPYRATVIQLADALDLSAADRAALLAASRRPLPRQIAQRPATVPRPLTPLIGREHEVEDVVGRLRGGRARLLTLTGPGGVGKTRLALEVAGQLQDGVRDGVCVVYLAALKDPELVPSTIARALGVNDVGRGSGADGLVRALAEKEVILLLDNMEHLLHAATTLGGLLAACPGVRMLVTSRAPLRIDGEQEYPVGPLPTPDPLYAPPVQALERYAAVELFVQRVQAVRPEFRLSDANAMTVVQICSRLDGLPLALELAAARTKLIPPQALARGLTGGLRRLAGGGRDRDQRHHSMEDALDWSYALLTPDEQQLFARLSVFAGGWSLDAAEAVCEGAGEFQVLDGLGGLLDHSLVRQVGNTEPRFTMLETLREYAAEKLEQNEAPERVRDLHAEYYSSLAEDLGQQLAGADVTDALTRYEAEHHNMRAALAWTLEQREADTALHLIHGLYGFWYLRGHLTEGRAWADRALSLSGEATPGLRANALKAAGTLALRTEDREQARGYLQRALAIYQGLGDTGGQVDVLRQLGSISGEEGYLEEGIQILQQALQLSRRENNQWGIAACLDNLGPLYGRIGKPESAVRCLQEAVRVARQASIPGIAAGSACLLGQELIAQENWAEAELRFEEALCLAQLIGFVTYIAEALEGLARCAVRRDCVERAIRLLGTSSALRRRHDLPYRPIWENTESPELARAKCGLSPERWSEIWDEGSQMSIEEAAGYGLSDASHAASALP